MEARKVPKVPSEMPESMKVWWTPEAERRMKLARRFMERRAAKEGW